MSARSQRFFMKEDALLCNTAASELTVSVVISAYKVIIFEPGPPVFGSVSS